MQWPKKAKFKITTDMADTILADMADTVLRYDPKASPLHTLSKKCFPTERQLTLSRLTGRPPEDFIP